MADSIKKILGDLRVLEHVILPPEVDSLLSALELASVPVQEGNGISTGTVKLSNDASQSPIPGFDFALTAPAGVDPAPYKLEISPPVNPTSFKFWLVLAEQGQVRFVFKFVEGLPGLALTGAEPKVAADGSVSLEARPANDPKHAPVLVSRSSQPGVAPGPALLISGTPAKPATMRFTPDTSSTEGIVALGLDPSTVVLGSSKIGFDCPVLIIDDSETDKADGVGAPGVDPPLPAISADTPAWRGILARQLDFYLPADVPLFGGEPIKGYLAIPSGAGGAEMVIQSKVPARPKTPERPGRPGYSIRIESLDPTARGLSGLTPTLITASMELPLDEAKPGFVDTGGANQEVAFAAGKPVKVTATFARDPVNAPDRFKIAIGVAAQGQEGLLSVTSKANDGAKIFNTAAALATALIADKDVERKADFGDTKGVVLHSLLAAGTALSSMFTDNSRFVLHGVEIESTGRGSPVGGPILMTLDYSVAVRVTQVNVGVLSVSMKEDQPMRIRVRRVRMKIDPSKSGLEMIGLDFGRAEMEIEDPGAWTVEGLDSLFDVLGSRSGRGSSWIEVDLRFKLNLGPIKVSGATIRATLNQENGSVEATIRGLDAGLTIPAAIDGKGKLQLIEKGFAADLQANLLPLNVSADAGIIYAPRMIVLRLGVDLPAAIPLANSGFGLFGIGGLFGLSAVPKFPAEPDPVLRQLKWKPTGVGSFQEKPGQSTFGLDAVVGTLPDLGFSFSAKAGLMVTVPDVAVRGALNGRVLQPPVKMTDHTDQVPAGVSFLGFIGVDSRALSFGVMGAVNLLPLLKISVPLAGHFPFGQDSDDWYVYLGADGAPVQGRQIGPISAVVLPGILDAGADAYLMLRGRGIQGWPHGRDLPAPPLTMQDGFVAAFGFGLQNVFGVKPIVWADLYASLDLLIGAKPPTLAGFGRAGGSLNLGPFSLGVQSSVNFMARELEKYFWAEVVGRIEMLFFDVEGRVTIAYGKKPDITLPDPDRHPLDRLNDKNQRDGSLGALTDDSYRVVARLVEDPDEIKPEMHVWPDAIVSLPFAVVPEIAAGAGDQFPGVAGPGAPAGAKKVGSEMLFYRWRLNRVALADVTDEADKKNGPGKVVPGKLAARWQVPRGSISGDVSELLLLSDRSDLWVNRLADGGEGLPTKPLQKAADICHWSARAEMGWAIGHLASQHAAGFRLPPEPVSSSPLVSRVESHMRHYGVPAQGSALPLDQVFNLPAPFSLDGARLVAWPQPQEIKRPFAGHITAPNLRWLAGKQIGDLLGGGFAFIAQQITLDLVEPIVGGLLVLVADPKLFEHGDKPVVIRVIDETGNQWAVVDFVPLPNGETAALLRAPTSNAISHITVSFPVGSPVGVVGLGGVTVGARDAAARENKAIADEIARQQAILDAGPQIEPATDRPHQRTILEPGRLYRIDIDMTWSGEISGQDNSGQVVPAGGKKDQTLYKPKGSPESISTNRQLFFRTAPKPAAPAKIPYGSKELIPWLRKRQDLFEPEMIERYLAGYDPGQSEPFRFADDPLLAYFHQNHVAALAKAYGFDINVAVRRVDRPGQEHAAPLILTPKWAFGADPAYLSRVDQIRHDYALASLCAVLRPGATASVEQPLDTEAWYEVYVLAKATTPGVGDGRLPGVTFRTSRWRSPAEMFVSLGFPTAGEPVPDKLVVGDLAVSPPAGLGPAVIEGDDQAYENALAALGLDGWPVAESPRLSRLWVADNAGGWLFAGLMIESPEPIHRPGRVDLAGLTFKAGNGGAAVALNIHRRDRSGSRLIYMTASPFQVNNGGQGGTPHLVLSAKSTLNDVRTDISGTLAIPSVPSFSEES